MKKITLLLLMIIAIVTSSCSSDDNSNGNQGPQVVNIKFEVITSRNTDAIITTTLNNETETVEASSLPFSSTYAQTEVTTGTYIQMTYLENGVYVVTSDEDNSWTDYTADLNMYVNDELVKTETFDITELNFGIKEIDYTFN